MIIRYLDAWGYRPNDKPRPPNTNRQQALTTSGMTMVRDVEGRGIEPQTLNPWA